MHPPGHAKFGEPRPTRSVIEEHRKGKDKVQQYIGRHGGEALS